MLDKGSLLPGPGPLYVVSEASSGVTSMMKQPGSNMEGNQLAEEKNMQNVIGLLVGLIVVIVLIYILLQLL
jgi:hypothetical protein